MLPFPPMTISRKDFLRFTVTFGGVAAAAHLVGCGSDDSPSTTTDTGTGTDTGTKTDTGSGTDTGAGSDTGGGTDTGTKTDGSTEGGACTKVNGEIATNHGHVLDVPFGDLSATGDKTYDIKGTALHTHSVTLTEAQRKDIAAGKSVIATSTDGGAAHTHTCTITCA